MIIGYEERLRESIRRYKESKEKHPVDKIGYKLMGRELAYKMGVKCAIIYGIFNSIDEVNWDKLPNSFVIKPQAGCSESGVLPLNKEVNRYYNLLKSKIMNRDEVIKYFKKDIGKPKGGHNKSLWIEELIDNPLPYDWKIYCFNGRIGLIRQYDRVNKPKCTKYWDIDWKNIKEIAKKVRTYTINNDLPEPIHKQELLNIAEKISRAVRYPFTRVDLYDTDKGVYFGEITPHPGMEITLNDYWNDYLGKLWELAEKELSCE